jgi:DNA-binding winged helix-turn-helix (wHTH) protein
LWSEINVNPEVLRKYILEIRKALGDRTENPEFIETSPKRGYRFVAPVIDESTAKLSVVPTSDVTQEHATEEKVGSATAPSEGEGSSGRHRLWKFAIIPVLAVIAAAAIAGQHNPGESYLKSG